MKINKLNILFPFPGVNDVVCNSGYLANNEFLKLKNLHCYIFSNVFIVMQTLDRLDEAYMNYGNAIIEILPFKKTNNALCA